MYSKFKFNYNKNKTRCFTPILHTKIGGRGCVSPASARGFEMAALGAACSVSCCHVQLQTTVLPLQYTEACRWWCQITFGHGDRAIGSVSRQSALYGGGVVDWWLVGNVLRSRLADDWRIEPWLIAEFSDKENSQLRTCLRYSDVHSIICKEMRPSQFTANLHRHRHGMNGGHLNTGCDLLESS